MVRSRRRRLGDQLDLEVRLGDGFGRARSHACDVHDHDQQGRGGRGARRPAPGSLACGRGAPCRPIRPVLQTGEGRARSSSVLSAAALARRAPIRLSCRLHVGAGFDFDEIRPLDLDRPGAGHPDGRLDRTGRRTVAARPQGCTPSPTSSLSPEGDRIAAVEAVEPFAPAKTRARGPLVVRSARTGEVVRALRPLPHLPLHPSGLVAEGRRPGLHRLRRGPEPDHAGAGPRRAGERAGHAWTGWRRRRASPPTA